MPYDEIPPGSTLGILGDGQLGRMLGEAALPLGFKIITAGPGGKNSSTGYLSWQAWRWEPEWLKEPNDQARSILNEFARLASVVTTEWENVPAWMVEYLQGKGVVCEPGPQALGVAQDRRREKATFKKLGLRTAESIVIRNQDDLELAKHFVFPAFLKLCHGGYDGRGQVLVKQFSDMAGALRQLQAAAGINSVCLLEEKVDFVYEISIVCARNRRGDFVTYPATVNEHRDGILRRSTYRPGQVPKAIEKQAEEAAKQVAEALDYVGVMTLEMFVTEDGEVIMNEVAPRVHNSGHWTQDGCDISQFAMHVRAICNWPLNEPQVTCRKAIMNNVLTADELEMAKQLVGVRNTFVHLYDKAPKQGDLRKIGHVNTVIR